MQVGEGSAERVMIPRDAVQVIGDRSVVYLSDSTANGRFIEREVRLGAATNDNVEIVSGMQSGDSVVVQGSFAIRAERNRLGLRPPAPAGPPEVARQEAAPIGPRGRALPCPRKVSSRHASHCGLAHRRTSRS